MTKVGLVGFFGWGNYGDELFLRLWTERLSAHFEVSQVHDLYKEPYFSGRALDIGRAYDGFVIGGGDLVIPSKVSSLYWNRAWLQRPVYIAGVGVPTWMKYENPDVLSRMRSFFQHENVKYVGARDAESASWIRSRLDPNLEISVAPDLVFAMDLPRPRKYEKKTLGIVVRHRRSGEDDYSSLGRLVDYARNRGFDVVSIVLGSGMTGDADYLAAKSLPFEVDNIIRSEDIDELTKALGGLHALATMKFHGTVVATAYGVPSIVLSPTSKSANLYRLLDRQPLLSHLNDPHMSEKLDLAELRVPKLSVQVLQRRADEETSALVAKLKSEMP